MNVLSFYVFSNIKISRCNHMSDILEKIKNKKNLRDNYVQFALDFPMKFKQINNYIEFDLFWEI